MYTTLKASLFAYTAYQVYNYFTKVPEREVPLLLDISKLPKNDDSYFIQAFVYAGRENIFRITAVCKKWKQLTESAPFYESMWAKYKDEVFGEREWKQYYGNPGNVPAIPERLFKLYCRIPSTLIWKPASVLRPGIEEPQPFSLANIGEWSAHPLEDSGGHAVGYDPQSWDRPHTFIVEEHKAEWLLLSRVEVPVKFWDKPITRQCDAYRINHGESAKTSDVALLFFTDIIRTGNSRYAPNPVTQQIRRVRTAERISWIHHYHDEDAKIKREISITFTPEGVRICPHIYESDYDKKVWLVLWRENLPKKPIRVTKMVVMDHF